MGIGGAGVTIGRTFEMAIRTKSIKILIAEDHAVVRKGTHRILEQEIDLRMVAEAADGEDAVRSATSSKPDVTLIDITTSEGYYRSSGGIR